MPLSISKIYLWMLVTSEASRSINLKFGCLQVAHVNGNDMTKYHGRAVLKS